MLDWLMLINIMLRVMLMLGILVGSLLGKLIMDHRLFMDLMLYHWYIVAMMAMMTMFMLMVR